MTPWIDKAKDWLLFRGQCYQQTFNGPRAEVVLKDLAKFCRAHTSTGHKDPYIAARLDGRREVFLRIQAHLKLSDDDLWKLFGEKTAGR